MNKMIMKRLFVIIVIGGLAIGYQGCSGRDTKASLSINDDALCTDNPVIHSSVVAVPDEFIGKWTSTEICYLPDFYPHELVITRENGPSDRLEITWDKRTTTPFNAGYKLIENDSEGVKYEILTEVEYFEKNKRMVTGMIWKKVDEDKEGKNLAIIVKTYELTESGDLIFEKYGYTTYDEDGALIFAKYADSFPENYHCVFSRK